jgi:hypothetical protein
MEFGEHHAPMDPIAFPIALDRQRRALEGAVTEPGTGQAPRTTRRFRRRGTS